MGFAKGGIYSSGDEGEGSGAKVGFKGNASGSNRITGSLFDFDSGSDSNVVIRTHKSSGKRKIEIDVYYV